jgi:propanediol utilization protein
VDEFESMKKIESMKEFESMKEIESIVTRVLEQLERSGKRFSSPSSISSIASTPSPRRREIPCEIPIEASARHVHLNAGALERLFGEGARLRKKHDLSQPGEFLAEQRVKLVTPKGEIANVAVVGPLRPYVQAELSRTDCRILDVNPPLNVSGDLKDAADVFIVGERGIIEAKGSAIVARAHVHLRAADAESCGLADGDRVGVKVESERPVAFNEVVVRVSDNFSPAVHIDFDEANACMLDGRSRAYLLFGKNEAAAGEGPEKICATPRQPGTCSEEKAVFEEKVVTEAAARRLAASCEGNSILVKQGVILTPSARDVFSAAKKTVERVV